MMGEVISVLSLEGQYRKWYYIDDIVLKVIKLFMFVKKVILVSYSKFFGEKKFPSESREIQLEFRIFSLRSLLTSTS